MQTHIAVLLAEHDTITGERFAAELVERFGMTVHMARDQREAAEIVDNCKIEGAFIALDHPCVDTNELIEKIRTSGNNGKISIVVLAATEDLQPLAAAARAGADHFLVKPLIRPQLQRLMRAVYERMIDSRRMYQRAPVDFPVLCHAGDKKEVGQSVNMSASGILINVKGQMDIRQGVQLTFPFNRDTRAAAPSQQGQPEPFVVQGRVARVQSGNRVAVSFADMPPEQLTRLKMWVEMALFCEPEKLN